jgi:hypothetical protein
LREENKPRKAGILQMKNIERLFDRVLKSKPNVKIKLLGDSITQGVGVTLHS